MRGTSWSRVLLTIVLIIVFTNGLAISSLAKTKKESERIIDDPKHYLSKDEITNIETEAKKLPEYYKIIILDNINGSSEEAARTFFNIRQYPQDTILILAIAEKKEIFIVTGEAAEKKGLDKNFFNKEISQYFIPEMKENSVATALIELMRGISKDISKQLITSYQKDTPKIPTPHIEEGTNLNEQKNMKYSSPFWIITIILTFMIVWFLAKKFK